MAKTAVSASANKNIKDGNAKFQAEKKRIEAEYAALDKKATKMVGSNYIKNASKPFSKRAGKSTLKRIEWGFSEVKKIHLTKISDN